MSSTRLKSVKLGSQKIIFAIFAISYLESYTGEVCQIEQWERYLKSGYLTK